jgi:protein subunit release factor A
LVFCLLFSNTCNTIYQDRVSDHRTGVTIAGVDRVLSGEKLNDILIELIDAEDKVLLENFLQSVAKNS